MKVLSEEECERSVDDIWNYIEQFQRKRKVKTNRVDPSTWHDWLPMACSYFKTMTSIIITNIYFR